MGTKTAVALRDIQKDEEITIDYSMSDADPIEGNTLHRSHKDCRKEIKTIYTFLQRSSKHIAIRIPLFPTPVFAELHPDESDRPRRGRKPSTRRP